MPPDGSARRGRRVRHRFRASARPRVVAFAGDRANAGSQTPRLRASRRREQRSSSQRATTRSSTAHRVSAGYGGRGPDVPPECARVTCAGEARVDRSLATSAAHAYLGRQESAARGTAARSSGAGDGRSDHRRAAPCLLQSVGRSRTTPGRRRDVVSRGTVRRPAPFRLPAERRRSHGNGNGVEHARLVVGDRRRRRLGAMDEGRVMGSSVEFDHAFAARLQ
jgi:hypothetical protein